MFFSYWPQNNIVKKIVCLYVGHLLDIHNKFYTEDKFYITIYEVVNIFHKTV